MPEHEQTQQDQAEHEQADHEQAEHEQAEHEQAEHEQALPQQARRGRAADGALEVPHPRSPGDAAPRLGSLVGAVDEVVEAVVDRLVESVEHCLAELEAMPSAGVVERLEHVALSAARAWDAPGIWVGSVEGERVTTRVGRCLRSEAAGSSGSSGPAPCAEGADLEDRIGPLETRAELVKVLDGGSVLVRPGDGTELGERLPALRAGAAVAAGGYDHDARQWLVAVTLSEAGADAAIARLALTSMVQAALALPVSALRGR